MMMTCGLEVKQRMHHQITGEPVKFLTLADWTGMVETELLRRRIVVTVWPRCGIGSWKSRPKLSSSRTGGIFVAGIEGGEATIPVRIDL
jgi:hypothetical protein